MSQDERKEADAQQNENATPEATPPAEEKPAETPASDTTAETPPAGEHSLFDKDAVVADLGSVSKNLPRLLINPISALKALHRPGTPALVQGLALGVGTALLVPLIQFLVYKIRIGKAYSPPFGKLLEQWLGGLLFLGAAALVTFLLRPAVGERGKDWKDDIYLVGSTMVFLLAGTILGGILMLFTTNFFDSLGNGVAFAGIVLSVLALNAGLQTVAESAMERAFWVAAIALTVAAIVGSLLGFQPSSFLQASAFQYIRMPTF